MAKRKKRNPPADELDLVPIMNLVTILIPFLLMASSFVELAVINSSAPAIGAPTPNEAEEDESLNLSVIITDEGFTVAGSDATLKSEEEAEETGPTVPCKKLGCPTPSSYDIQGLQRTLSDIKDRWPDEWTVILVPEGGTAYEVLVATMDATRNDPDGSPPPKDMNGNPLYAGNLFPEVVIAGGAD